MHIYYRLKEKYNELEATGRPVSPTETNISTGSQGETSMYGSVFRRASNAIIFLRQISQLSKENSPNGSRLTVRDLEVDEEQYVTSETDLPILPQPNETTNVLHLPKLVTNTNLVSDAHVHSDSSSSSRKKKKKSKHRSKEGDNNLQVPEIKIIPW